MKVDKDKLNELLEQLVKTGDEVCMVQRTCEGCPFDTNEALCTILETRYKIQKRKERE